MQLDILAIMAHPDDAELSCGGTLAKHKAAGKRVGIIDLTRGELGTRGTPELREEEAQAASKILGLDVRGNLELTDGFIGQSHAEKLAVIRAIRKYRPSIILTNAIDDRHPDHANAALLVKESAFLAGLYKIETFEGGREQDNWRPRMVLHILQDRLMIPDVVVDITAHFVQKMEAIKAYRSQFFDPTSDEPETWISRPDFLPFQEARSREMGHMIGAEFGEGFTTARPLGVESLLELG